MIQLAFEPAFDPFHTGFRILRQMVFGDAVLDVFRLKIIDVYIVEPRRCEGVRVPPKLKKAAKLAAACQSPTYGRRPGIEALFNRVSPIQDAALQTLVMHGLLDADAFGQDKALRTKMPLSASLLRRITSINDKQKDLMKFLLTDLGEIDLNGPNGLKARTGLGEYRYDLI